ncbi:MAG: hypothetical protein PHI20_02810 [Endomicrobiaceae bacterium]|nr:hypothetical protein [Endomicrobiaceae bacterium]MDD3729948.1 hypothetical protein [Endomicrobiaceae bacterium]MDD4166036.1 hypothetical protein [Endomicrobiaceae bacterium]
MKYAFLTDNIGVLNKIQKPDILYFGNEFCQNIIPAKQHINKAFQWALKNNIQFVFVLPYITNDKVKTADSLLHILNNKKRNIEIVFNDWGTLSLILKYKNLQPVLGRLLTKQRKDPIAENIIQNTQNKIKIAVIDGKKTIIKAKKVPLTLKTYFQKSFLDVGHVIDFMTENNIKRYELDLLPWGIKIKTDKKIKLSIYYPYVNITTTRYCGAVNLKYTKICSKICKSQIIEAGTNKLKYPYIIKGNAVFYKTSKDILDKTVNAGNIDRIVINDLQTLNKLVTG